MRGVTANHIMSQISPAKENSHTQPLKNQQPSLKAQTALIDHVKHDSIFRFAIKLVKCIFWHLLKHLVHLADSFFVRFDLNFPFYLVCFLWWWRFEPFRYFHRFAGVDAETQSYTQSVQNCVVWFPNHDGILINLTKLFTQLVVDLFWRELWKLKCN